MEYLVTGRQAKAIDTYTIEQTGIPSLVLMERASLCVAEEVQKTAEQMHLPVVRIAVALLHLGTRRVRMVNGDDVLRVTTT